LNLAQGDLSDAIELLSMEADGVLAAINPSTSS